MVTNIIIDNGKWKERWLLPPFRKEHDRLLALAQEDELNDGRAIVVEGNDGLWWNDDLYFVLERMADLMEFGCAPSDDVHSATDELEDRKWNPGDSAEVKIGQFTIRATADETPVDHGEYKFL